MPRICSFSFSAAVTLALALVGWQPVGSVATNPPAANPFFAPSSLPFQAPPFDRIHDSDFQPAIDEGMKRQMGEIEKIANDPAPPTFENTIVTMEKSGQMLDRVTRVFSALTQANTDDSLQKIQAYEAPRLAAHHDAIFMSPKLFARVRAIYAQRGRLTADPEARQLVKVYYRRFVRAGALLPEAEKARLRAIDEKISSLQTTFQRQILAANKAGALVVDQEASLAGLSPIALAAAAHAAQSRGLKGKWLIPLQNTTQQPALASLQDRAVRKKLFEDSWTRAEKGDANDTRDTIATVAELRAEKARILGFPNYSAYRLQDEMARTPAAVEKFLGQLVPPTRDEAHAEAAALQTIIRRDGKRFTLRPWDWEYYAGQMRKQRYNLDENEVKSYFVLDNVLKDGVFYAAHELYGITFKERNDLPVYQPDVRVFEVFDKDGSPLGLIYFDYFKRDNKSGGAWMDEFVGESKLLGAKPVIYNVANFTKPAPGQPALISFDDVTTMFHEFGHALHGLFSDQEYSTLTAINTSRDFVEFPSQFNEHWALDPQVLRHYARNYKTGKPMPPALVKKIRKSAKFDQGYQMGELLAAAELDMQWHTLPGSAPKQNVDQFEDAALRATRMDLPDVPPRYRSSYFMHIWDLGYASGYYAYLWCEMLDDDAFQWFQQHGGLTRSNGQRFRDLILSRGRTEDYGKMFREFYGKNPEVGPLLEHRGLASAKP